MDNKFLTYTGIIALVMSIPGLLQMNDMTTGFAVCIIGLVLTFYLYKKYTDEAEDKTKNTVGQGVKFGAVAGVFMTLLALINIFLFVDLEAMRMAQIDALAPMADFMGEEAYDLAVQQIEEKSLDDIQFEQILGSFMGIISGSIIGLIAGLIFKHRDDEE